MDPFIPIQAIDGLINGVLPPLARIILWSGLAGAISMGIYAVASPQERLKELSRKSRELMAALAKHDGEFSEHMDLTKQNLSLAFKRLGHTIPATILALAPAIYILVWMETAFQNEVFLDSGPSWARGWMTPALASLITVSLVIKKAFRIE